jgi:chromosome partitioning protein
MRIISIANQKGGCGKTTTAINLASALGHNGRKVLLIDLDPQAHASLGLNIEGQDSIYNVISKLTPRTLRIENIIKRVEGNFDIVPSNVLVGTLEQELADEIGRELKLLDVIAPVRDRYDYVLIDCPPSLGILTVNALRASTELIIPVETSRFSIQGVEHILDIVHLVRDRLNHTIACRVLITMFDSRLRHSFAMLETFRERFGELLFDTFVHINVKLKESAVMGQTVAFYDKYSRGSKDYFTLSKEILLAEGRPDSRVKPEAAVRQEAEAVEIADYSVEPAVAANQASEGAAAAVEPVPVSAGSEASQSFSPKMQEIIREQAREMRELFPIRFTYEAPNAKSVFVTGSFNDWSLDDTCRLKAVDGRWEAVIPLKQGVYKYQFIVDGVWRDDPKNPRRERNSFGDVNSLFEVKSDGQSAAQ